MARKQYSKSDIKKFIELNSFAETLMNKKSKVVEEDETLSVNDNICFIKIEDTWLPHIKILLQHPDLLPKVTVDMGAVKFVIKGADIMRPGITAAEEFEKNAYIVIIDENNKKSLAVGKALISSEDLMQANSGKVIQNLFYVGDKYWNL